MGASILKEGKNTDGVLGDKCNNCGGFGFTMSMKGKLGCNQCDQTGVRLPTNRELQDQISVLKKDLSILKKALLDTLGMNGLSIKEEIGRTTNV